MADLATQQITTAGSAPSFAAADAVNDTAEVGSGRDTFVVYKNANVGTAATISIATPGDLATGVAYPEREYTVPASGEVWVPLIKEYLDPNIPGRCTITATVGVADLTVAVVRR